MKSCEEMPIFYGILLQDSFILSWSLTDDCLEFIVDFSLWPNCSFYEAPKQAEWTCYKQGKLIFLNPSNITGLRKIEDITPIIDQNGEKDFGSIDYLGNDSENKFRMGWEKEEITLNAISIEVVIN